MRVLVVATEAEAQRVIDAIDSLRPPRETVVHRSRGRVVRTEEVPARTWAEPIPLEGSTEWGVPFPARKVDPAWEGRTVSVRGTPTRIGTRAETVEREVASDVERDPATGRLRRRALVGGGRGGVP